MRTSRITREQALDLLRTYNKESFHIQHALTVEGVMRWFAQELGYEDEIDYWGISGLLHDIDFEMYPDEHCKKAPERLGWELNDVFGKTILAMRSCEEQVQNEMKEMGF